jgi:hypothetical protein
MAGKPSAIKVQTVSEPTLWDKANRISARGRHWAMRTKFTGLKDLRAFVKLKHAIMSIKYLEP